MVYSFHLNNILCVISDVENTKNCVLSAVPVLAHNLNILWDSDDLHFMATWQMYFPSLTHYVKQM